MPIYFEKLGEYGHLGNSLFQAGCTIALAKRNNDSFKFPIKWKYKDQLNLPVDCFISNIKSSTTYHEPDFHYNPIPYKPNMNLLGYFQSSKYFDDFEDNIKHLLRPKYNLYRIEDTTSIHVRRGDYLKHPNHHPILPMKYYESAMELTNTKRYLVFSDDIPWCKKNFIGNQFDFSEEQNEVLDLELQSKCTHNIIANSSFSWWGAYLNENQDKIVIAPKAWFGPALFSHNTKDLYINSWIKI